MSDFDSRYAIDCQTKEHDIIVPFLQEYDERHIGESLKRCILQDRGTI
jgi:hypothetical protein